MARQHGPPFIVGTIGDLIFYEVNGEYFVKQKPIFSKKKRKAAGERPRMQQIRGHFGKVNKMASAVYQSLGSSKKSFMFQELKNRGLAMDPRKYTLEQVEAKMLEMKAAYLLLFERAEEEISASYKIIFSEEKRKVG